MGVRSLKGVTEMSSPGRVLDLHALASEMAEDEDYKARPLFVHPVLNRAIIAKQRIRPGEEGNAAPGRADLTKVIFPFDPNDLDLGGHRLILDSGNLANALARQLDYRDLPIDRDLEVLALLDRLPSLDPFLTREALKRRGIVVADCYFQFRPAEQDDMLSFVATELEALIALCVGRGPGSEAKAKRMSALILADEESPELVPLQQALRMNGEEFAKAMFAWKGFLYYRWKVRDLSPGLRTALRAISQIPVGRCEDTLTDMLRSAKALSERAVTGACDEVRQTLRIYSEAFRSLTEEQDADGFRAFLETGPALFIDLGVRIGQLEQVVGVWTWRFSTSRMGGVGADKLLDALRDLLQEIAAPPMAVIQATGEGLAPRLRKRAAG